LQHQDALLTLPGIHQEHAGLVRHRLILGNYTGAAEKKSGAGRIGSCVVFKFKVLFLFDDS